MAVTFLTNEDGKKFEKNITKLSEEMARQPGTKPLVFINGSIPTTKDEVLAELTYISSTERFHAYLKIKCQGKSSLLKPKKNFTIKMYSDEARDTKLKKEFNGWGVKYHKYVLKANWVDVTHARNRTSAEISSDIVESRPDYESLPAEIRNSPNNCAVDGFPVIVYTNGVYQGIYTWNIGKDDWMFGMDEDNPDHIVVCGETNSNYVYKETPCNFRTLWNGVDEQDWTVEVGENNETVKNALNALISCVKDTQTLDEFKAQIVNHLDILSAIDYFLSICMYCGVDNMGNNVMLAKYMPLLWYMFPYDLDMTWGLLPGQAWADPKLDFPRNYAEGYSLLFERLAQAYPQEFKKRGKELRKGPLSYANIMHHFENSVREISDREYADDIVAYPELPLTDSNNIWQIRNFVRERLEYFDNWLESYFVEPIECTGVTLSASKLTFNGEGTQTLTATLEPSTTNEFFVWTNSNPTVAKFENGVVTALADGTATITAKCGRRSASCTVTVSGITAIGGKFYELSEPVEIASFDDVINTGVVLLDSDKSFTIAADVTPIPSGGEMTVFGTGYEVLSNGINIRSIPNSNANYALTINAGDPGYAREESNVAHGTNARSAFVLKHTAGSNDYILVSNNGTETVAKTVAAPASVAAPGFVPTALYIGALDGGKTNSDLTRLFTGTIHRFVVYDHVLTDDEVNEFISGMV